MSTDSDNLDHASEVEEVFREKAILAARTTEKAPKDFDGKTCFVCASDIPEARLALSKFRCVGCQEIHEKESKLYRRYT